MKKQIRIAALLAVCVLAGACAGKQASALERALSTAVREEKLSDEKMESILREYDSLRDEDKVKARTYAEQIETALKMGGDSTHIDVVRRMMLRAAPKPQV